MSITDELRKAADDIASTAVPCGASPDYIGVRRKIAAIADRIDAEHERVRAESIIDMTDESMAEHGWIRLPKDADGEFINAGDVMEERSGHTFEVASLMAFEGSDNWLVLSDPRNFSSFREPHDIRHHHAPTVEDVLREFAHVGIRIAAKHGIKAGEFDFYADEEAISEFAAKLRLAEGED